AYLCRPSLTMQAFSPLRVAKLEDRFDITIKCLGGGNSGQAGAIRHGIARALVQYDDSLRKSLRVNGMLTRDPRVKERKKYGRKRARRGFQFSKR
ncbi:MAG TPA: 30S ribosomal protein S9, partial [Armatimonadota bacterium]